MPACNPKAMCIATPVLSEHAFPCSTSINVDGSPILDCALCPFCRSRIIAAGGLASYFNFSERGKMKKIILLVIALNTISISGCGIGGFHFVPPRPGPVPSFSDRWTKPGMTEESWLQDWMACGGSNTGHVNEFPRVPGETDYDQHERTWNTLHRCMMSKGYRFTGDCTREWNKRRPGCGVQ
jgi:hypothetical protein